MIRRIDAEQRRTVLAEAVWRVVLRDGLPAASVRTVAIEAGLSAGSVRHFFATQDELLLFAMSTLADRVRQRIAKAAQIEDVPERVLAMVCELLPLTDTAEAEFAIWLQFLARSRVEPTFQAVAQQTFDDTRDFLTTVVRGQQELGLRSSDIDVSLAVTELNALLDGLVLDLIYAPHLTDRMTARRLVADRLGGSPPRKGEPE